MSPPLSRWFRKASPAGEAGATVPAALAKGFHGELETVAPGWRRKGTRFQHRCGVVVTLERRPDHSSSPRHVDVYCSGFVQGGAGLWDCVVGHGGTDKEIGQAAGHLWCQTTGLVILELALSRRGEFANHYSDEIPGGFPGWHSIVGSPLGIGDARSGEALVNWWQDNQIPAAIGPALEGSIDPTDGPFGIKMMCGGSPGNDGAEVSLNGVAHDAASAALNALDFPRLAPPAFLRTFALLLHPT